MRRSDTTPLTFGTLALALLLAAPAGAEVRMASIFADGMVLQRGMPVPVWGAVGPGEAVTITFRDQTQATTAGPDGQFRLALDPLEATPPGEAGTLVVATPTERRTFNGVLVGDVWICAGQSNMEWPLSRAEGGAQAVATARHDGIRLFAVERDATEWRRHNFKSGQWLACAPDTAGSFSAVGYFFGRALHEELDVPIGLVNLTWGGTPAEAWTELAALTSDPRFYRLLETWARGEEGKPQHRPGNLFNAMVSPMVTYAIRGVIWYQGEANADRAHEYRALFPAMIRNWRLRWRQGDFPFHFVQLPNFRAPAAEPGESAWAELREAQLMTLRSEPATGMAVTIDLGVADDIHPRNKLDVARRLARSVLATEYGRPLAPTGPLFRSTHGDGARVVVTFDHVGGGLVASGGAPLTGFTVAGQDRRFVRADARIDGDTVVVSAPAVPAPVAVRYAWADNPAGNLENDAGLPASPFRTDAWPGITARRPLDPWVYRGPIGPIEEAIIVGLHQDLWLAIDPRRAGVALAWARGVSYAQPVPDPRSGPQPRPAGRVHHEQPAAALWSFAEPDGVREAVVAFDGFEVVEDRVVFRTRLRPPGREAPDVLVEVWPEDDATVDGKVALVQRLVVTGLAPGAILRWRLDGDAPHETWSVEGAGTLAFEPDPALGGTQTLLEMDRDGTATVRTVWTNPEDARADVSPAWR